MKAIVYTKYGPPEVLHVKEVDKPVPKDGQLLIKIYATTVNRTDCGFRSAHYFISRVITGLAKPKNQVAGSEFAGRVVEVGTNVNGFKLGDNVFGFEDVKSGAHADYMVQAANGSIAKIPRGFSYLEVAAAGEGATYAINFIRSAGVRQSQKVLVYGASGAIGSASVQILKSIGAEVTAVCGTKNIQLIQRLGADTVIDYQKQDFTQIDDQFDLVLDAVGKSNYAACKKLLKPTGSYCSSELGPGCQNPFLAVWFAITRSRRVIFPIPKINKEIMEYIADQLKAGSYRPLIDRTYSFDEIIEATKYVETGEKTGNVVINLSDRTN